MVENSKSTSDEIGRDVLEKMVKDLQSTVEFLEEERTRSDSKLEEFARTVDKLNGEIVAKDKPRPKLPLDVIFRKLYPKAKYMVLHAIRHGELKTDKDGKDRNVVTDFKVGKPFPANHEKLEYYLDGGQVVQVVG